MHEGMRTGSVNRSARAVVGARDRTTGDCGV